MSEEQYNSNSNSSDNAIGSGPIASVKSTSADLPGSKKLMQRLKALITKKNNEPTLQDTLEMIDEEDEDEAPLTAEQVQFLRNIVALRNDTISDLMVPRVRIEAIERHISFDEMVAAIAKAQHSRLPVYDEDLDNSLGMVHIRDVLKAIYEGKKPTIDEIMREVLFVSPSSPALEVLAEMRSKRIHLAMVADEYGGIDGLVTIEDIVEQIVGDIQDEHDSEEVQVLIKRQNDNSIIAEAQADIEELEKFCGISFFSRDDHGEIETIGGLVTALAGRVPHIGEKFTHKTGVLFEVVQANPRRVERVKLTNLPPPIPK